MTSTTDPQLGQRIYEWDEVELEPETPVQPERPVVIGRYKTESKPAPLEAAPTAPTPAPTSEKPKPTIWDTLRKKL